MSSNCALLVTSCDAYADAWEPFFKLLSIMWPECPYPLYLNTETKSFSPAGMNVVCLHPDEMAGRTVSWSKRLKLALEKIDAEYILFFLEDFFLQAPVRQDIVEDCIRWMQQDESVVFIDFYHDKTENDEIYLGEFSRIQQSNDWAINANCALWRKSFLESILRDENPWEFELNATARWRRTGYQIFTHRKEFSPVFLYQFETINGDWSGILKGKWLTLVPELFAKYGIEVDFSQRGLIDPPDMRPREREDHWLLHDIQNALRDPKAMAHYLKCTYDVAKDKLVRLKRKYFNP